MILLVLFITYLIGIGVTAYAVGYYEGREPYVGRMHDEELAIICVFWPILLIAVVGYGLWKILDLLASAGRKR